MKSKFIVFVVVLLVLGTGLFFMYNKTYTLSSYEMGQPIDSLNGVKVYYNGRVSNTLGRNRTSDNYNLGLKYQCVEFVKRYYYEYFNHKMPDSYGHAKDFFNKKYNDGELNIQRGLIQYSNPSQFKPQVNDLVVFSASHSNSFGHVAIISEVTTQDIEIIQQNSGSHGNSRARFTLSFSNGKWEITNDRILGWLRKE